MFAPGGEKVPVVLDGRMVAVAVPAANTPPLVAVTVMCSVCVPGSGFVAFCGAIWM